MRVTDLVKDFTYMGMFTENDTGNRCYDCSWADSMEQELNRVKKINTEILFILKDVLKSYLVLKGYAEAPKKEFAKGGIVSGNCGTDYEQANTTPGEMVLTKEMQLSLFRSIS